MAGYVLIVESDAELQRQIGAALKQAGFDLAAETEAAWAKKSVGTRMPDVVVVDTRLADGDGFTLADELRRAPETRAHPDPVRRQHPPRRQPPRRGPPPVRARPTT